jgi:mannose-6-phosphate isomerase
MSRLYPLLIRPEFHERVWGTRDLAPVYDKKSEKPIGEAWLTGDECKIQNGALAGKSLGDLCQQFGAEFVGSAAPVKDRFPLLIKFLFPHEKLSVQVHPDDEGARHLGQPCGKTECWYVFSAERGAQVGVGLKSGTKKDEVERAVRELRLEKLLNWIDVRIGDLIYVEAGTVHAIGPGAILVETQQNSGTTFRLYDYGRPCELHLEQGLAATKERVASGKVEPRRSADGDTNLVTASRFVVDRLELKNAREFVGDTESSRVFVGLRGRGVVEAPGSEPVSFGPGEAVVVPAALEKFTLRSDQQLECLQARLPARGEAVDVQSRIVAEAANFASR